MFRLSEVRGRFSDAELLVNLRAFGAEYGPRDRTMLDYRAWPKRCFHDRAIIAQFGTWLETMKPARLDHYTRHASAPTRVDIADELRRFAKAIHVADRTLGNLTGWRYRTASTTAIPRCFGSWFDALRELGIAAPGRTKSTRHSKEEIIEAFERIWRWCGRPPSIEDFKKYARRYDDGVSFGTVYHHFGPLKPFLAAFILWKDGKLTLAQLLTQAMRGGQREPVPPKVRCALLDARDYNCEACGKSPKRHPGTVPHIDHILPVSKGGTKGLSNLRVLCQTFNIGRSNHFTK